MTTLKEYLEEKAVFLVPPGAHENKSDASTDVSAFEVQRLHRQWKPIAARLDEKMVDSLSEMLDEYIQDRLLETPDHYNYLFQPIVDQHGFHVDWQKLTDEYTVRLVTTISHS